ncbi:MAG: hypothetical protein Q3988_03595 [Gemella sp.]|nr:hypothetical protein [Gemella sp.]
MLIISEIMNIFIVGILIYTLVTLKRRGIKGKFLPSLIITYITLIVIERINFYLIGNGPLALVIYALETIVLITFLITLVRANRRK